MIMTRLQKNNVTKQNNKRRVVMIGHKTIPSRQGGVEIVVDRLSTGLAADGYEVWAYNRGRAENAEDCHNGVRIRHIPAPASSGLNAFVYACLATIRATIAGFDVYHYHAEGPCVMLWLPAFVRRRSRIIVTIHGLDWQRAKWGRFASLVIRTGEKQAVRHADEIIVLSRNVQRYFTEIYGRKTVYVPNGVDRPEPVSPALITERFGLSGNDYVLFVARIVPEKGLHYLIEAFKKIKTDKKLVIAGGSGQADDYMRRITEMASGDDRIILTGFVEGRTLAELYSNAYLYVCPSDVEGMSLSLLEAASYGNCCLISDIPENAEVMEDHSVTFLHGDSEDLRSKLEALIESPGQVASLRSSTADFICSKYDWNRMIADTGALYGNPPE